MKKVSIIISKSILCIMFVFVAASCTKEGPAGKDGAPGVNGENGINGTDGTTTCIECHDNSQVMFARENQWAHSTHATGGNYERNEGECAICHTSQGFLGNLDGSYDWEAAGAIVDNPNPPNCYTCHKIHDTYTPADLAYTVTGAVALNNVTETYDFGAGSLCASCHQGRTVDPFPVEDGGEIVVTSSRYGVHHGPQANALSGLGLVEFGTVTSNHPHKTIENTCVSCHMAEPYGAQAGGHTMFMGYDYHGTTELNLVGCMECHTDEESLIANTEEFQMEIAVLLAELKVLLDTAGITAEGSDSSIPGTFSSNVAGACLNYKALTEDRSLGIHNPTYIKKILKNSITALQ